MSRPKINPPLSVFDIILESLAALFVLWMIATLIMDYPALPERVPTHFNASGEADDWGGKPSLLLLPVIAVVLYAGLTILNRFPYAFNYPFEITEENAERQYRLAKTMVITVKMMVTGSFLYIHLKTMAVAKGTAGELGAAFVFILLAGTFVPVIIYFIVASRNK